MYIQFRPFILSAFLLSTTLALPALAASTAALLAVPTALTWGVSDIDLDAGRKSVGLAIDEVFDGKEKDGPLGFALHPEFGLGKSVAVSALQVFPPSFDQVCATTPCFERPTACSAPCARNARRSRAS